MLSGVKPTGRPHIGNYFGAMKQFVDLQSDFDEVFVFIADYHAMTSDTKKLLIGQNSIELALDYLAIGLDPEKVILFRQSSVPQVTELSWIFSCLVTMPYLMRAHAFKDAEAKKKEVNVGTFNYPVLMSADILIQDADIVPVGNDQKQHLEIAREIARKFNTQYGMIFKEPQEKILEETETVIGIDGQKMSKSYGNTIPLFATDEETEKIIMSVPMDSKGIDEKKNPDDYNLYKIAKLFTNENQDKEIRSMFENGGVGYAEIKKYVANVINNYLKEMRERRKELENNRDYVLEILEKGGKIARERAEKKMEEVRVKCGLNAE
ncbi:TPA: tryptophan--tRNA ligase [Candidatus Campbellbacteria bacterium]|nr:MAG: tryptophanyl-tRNA synthetase, tryptophanyl-tRNA synthetase [Candidatus Campbellbacteria bacterium GW2011_OD1_34_28]KKP75038.1 MAG: Tryptophan-tRNA ligase [Candidatus Campbellbacteria bacterium GW2011_GWD2_35_24]KKP75924.1 MAG: tryptophanyl-tRNA synthetase, tryptophanyl-tRNA synthetase [Candidatus Campbellbacteria bacterium GW2011_GWC2_35_28]KKP76828.1 MAG: Tryptophan-tRNA ligase [Candidatus Campbellbacteria bacterium GW2011_GWC1_35_31]KKP78754.1 MAG: Tryptophan-tRNA ligase [Candidatus C